MKHLTIMALFCSSLFGDGIMMTSRSHQSFRQNAATTNVPGTPVANSSSLVLSAIGNAQHLMLCHESTSRIRINWRKGSTSTPPASTEYQMIIPAAASGSFTCFNADDVQLSSTVYIWNDAGSAISSGLFYGSTW